MRILPHFSEKKPAPAAQTAVITGAASGIGQALAQSLATRGYSLHLMDINTQALNSTVAHISHSHPTSVLSHNTIDVSDHAAVMHWAQAISTEHGIPDEVHHIAGIAVWGDATTMPHEQWKRVIDINLMGSIHMVEAFSPLLVNDDSHRRRKLVLVSSAAGIIGLPWHAAYSASKGGILGMCEVLRFDLAPRGVDVHVVAPGAVDTPLVDSIEIVGVDTTTQRVKKAKALFHRHAASPQQAAERIIKGVEKNKYLIFTSADIALARWAQINMPFAYKASMKLLGKGFRWAAANQATPTGHQRTD